jgi:uncharacterized YkwD family protein
VFPINKKNLILPILMILVVFSACTQQPIQGIESSISETGDIKRVKVISDKANVTSECSKNGPILDTLNKDAQCDVLSKVDDWYAVQLPDNSIGFVPEKQCKPIVVEDDPSDTIPNEAGTPEVPPTTPKANAGNLRQNNTGTNKTTNENSKALTNDEQEMLKLVNDARAQNNLEPLISDIELANVARIKSQDMIDNNYFSHNSPTYGSPFDMMKSFGIKYIKAGENIAGNQSVQKAHDALMNSPGHRQNILSPDYTHIGIGIKNGGQYGKMFTQMFISKPK